MRVEKYEFLPTSPPIAQLPLDVTLFEPTLCAPSDDRVLTEYLLRYYNSLTPSPEAQQALGNLVNRVSEILDSLIVSPSLFEAGQIESVRSVGSFKLGTWLAGSNIADMVVVFRTLPTREAVQSLANLIKMKLNSASDASVTAQETYEIELQPYGFNTSFKDCMVQVLVATIPMNLKRTDSEIHVNLSIQKAALAAIRHVRWLEENASHTTIKVLTRILKDFRRRFKGLHHLNAWMINLLAHHIVMNNPTYQALPLNQAFRRTFHLLAAGLLLPGSAGLLDPCESGHVRTHTCLTLTEQDEICSISQLILRILLHGQYAILLTHNDFDESTSRVIMCVAASRDKFICNAANGDDDDDDDMATELISKGLALFSIKPTEFMQNASRLCGITLEPVEPVVSMNPDQSKPPEDERSASEDSKQD